LVIAHGALRRSLSTMMARIEKAFGNDPYRCRIEEFIRARCPRGSACEYTDEELARLSSSSKAKPRFAPYDATE
jgi:hypothetical protein